MTTRLNCLVSATIRQRGFPSLRLTPVLYQQRLRMITVVLSHQSHQLSWVKTSLTVAGIHSLSRHNVPIRSDSPFESFPYRVSWNLDLPLTITVSIAALLLITSIIIVIFCCFKARKLGEHLSKIIYFIY